MSTRVAVAVLSLALPHAAAASGAGKSLRLVWCDPSGIAAGTFELARAEAGALLSSMGAEVSWRRAEAGEVRRTDEVWVVLLGDGPRQGSGRLVLGTTLRNPRVAPLVWVRVPNVQAALGIARRRDPDALLAHERRSLAIALGRVIAHELVHALVPELAHGRGLMSDSFSERQLTAATMPIEAEVALAFQAALHGDLVSLPPRTRVWAASRAADPCLCFVTGLR